MSATFDTFTSQMASLQLQGSSNPDLQDRRTKFEDSVAKFLPEGTAFKWNSDADVCCYDTWNDDEVYSHDDISMFANAYDKEQELWTLVQNMKPDHEGYLRARRLGLSKLNAEEEQTFTQVDSLYGKAVDLASELDEIRTYEESISVAERRVQVGQWFEKVDILDKDIQSVISSQTEGQPTGNSIASAKTQAAPTSAW